MTATIRTGLPIFVALLALSAIGFNGTRAADHFDPFADDDCMPLQRETIDTSIMLYKECSTGAYRIKINSVDDSVFIVSTMTLSNFNYWKITGNAHVYKELSIQEHSRNVTLNGAVFEGTYITLISCKNSFSVSLLSVQCAAMTLKYRCKRKLKTSAENNRRMQFL